MKKCLAILLLLLTLLPSALAQSEVPELQPSRVPVGGDDFLVIMKSYESWTFVTPANLEENMALCTKRGDNIDDVRARFQAGTIQWEAYHKSLPKGCVRMEIIEDAFTRNFFHTADFTEKYVAGIWKTRILEEWALERYNIYDIISLEWLNNQNQAHRAYRVAFVTKAPYPYESGIAMLTFYNGKAYFQMYTQLIPASKLKYLSNDSTKHFLYDKTSTLGGAPIVKLPILRDPYADLWQKQATVFNAHTGDFEYGGTTEEGVSVTVQGGGETVDAKVASDGAFTYVLPVHEEGILQVTYTATRKDRTENTLTEYFSVNDGMAALTLYTYPYGDLLKDKAEVSGKASPGAVVTLQIDEGAPQVLALDSKGEFKQAITADYFVQHAMTLTVQEEGLEECVVKMPFELWYEDAAKGIAAYKKQLDSDVKMKALFADPGQYVGKKVKLEVYVSSIERRDGNLYINANIYQNKDQKLILLCDSYLNDEIVDKMILTVYGEFQEPTLTDSPIPRLYIQFISYQKTVYSR